MALALGAAFAAMEPTAAQASECLLDTNNNDDPDAADGAEGADATGSVFNTACGRFANASGTGSFNTASGNSAIASGAASSNNASGFRANASGNNSGNNASGIDTNASGAGTQNTAVGDNSTATGTDATATGPNSTANNANSAAFGNGATTSRDNQQVFGTTANTYTTPGITSAASSAAQGAVQGIITTDAAGNLASDGGALQNEINNLGRRDEQLADGIAVALALEQPNLIEGQTFALRLGYGNFDGESAVGLSASGLVSRGALGPTSSVTLDAGVGFGTNTHTVAARGGVTIGW